MNCVSWRSDGMIDPRGHIGQPLIDPKRNAAISHIVFGQNGGMQSVNEAFFHVYNGAITTVPQTLSEFVVERSSRGWHGLAELFDNGPAVETRLAEIATDPIGTTIEISPLGEVITTTHIFSADRSQLQIISALTGCTVGNPSRSEEGSRGLLLLREILGRNDKLLDYVPKLSALKAELRTCEFFSNDWGKSIQLDQSQSQALGLKAETCGHSTRQPFEELERYSPCAAPYAPRPLSSSAGSGHYIHLDFEFFAGGPGFHGWRRRPTAGRVSAQSVRNLYPKMSVSEAEVIASMAEGRTIKEAAGHLGKSHVTVAIQARAALGKTDYSTLESLIPVIVLVCATSELERGNVRAALMTAASTSSHLGLGEMTPN